MTRTKLTRREIMTAAAAVGATSALPFGTAMPLPKPVEILHWSWLTASDGEAWQQMIEAFNAANKAKGVQIKLEVIPEEQYATKLLAATATGRAPDFGWGTAGLGAPLAKDGVTVPLDDPANKVGLDLADFTHLPLKASRYPQYHTQPFVV